VGAADRLAHRRKIPGPPCVATVITGRDDIHDRFSSRRSSPAPVARIHGHRGDDVRLAIGANSAIFSAVNSVLLRPLPVERPERIAVVWQTDERGQAVVELTYRHLREWTANGSMFTRAAVMGSHNWSAVLQGRGEPSRMWFAGVSAAFFDTLGVRPLLGRALRPEDDVSNAPAVAVLSHSAWVRRFGSDPHIVGTRMTLDGNAVEIIGVMPAGLDVPAAPSSRFPSCPCSRVARRRTRGCSTRSASSMSSAGSGRTCG
jgi:hypothetical protein